VVFYLILEHLVSREAPRGVILSGTAGTDVSSLCTFLKILSGVGPEYDSDEANGYSPGRKCFHIYGDQVINNNVKVTPPDLSLSSHATYLKEKAERLKA
jgi:hypothetical protein